MPYTVLWMGLYVKGFGQGLGWIHWPAVFEQEFLFGFPYFSGTQEEICCLKHGNSGELEELLEWGIGQEESG